MTNPFPFTIDNKRYHTWNYFLKNKFGKKVYKVPLTLANTCPNRDGSKSFGGCTFCLSGGGGTEYSPGHLAEQFEGSVIPLETKWPDSLSMPYFQSFSNTYLPAKQLELALNESLSLPKTIGICVATRPDCLPDDILEVLNDINRKTFLMIELGLQTIHQSTAEFINRGHTFEEFLVGYKKLADLNIPVCVHLINGLPYETEAMMLETVKQVSNLAPHSIKFHMLHILENTKLASQYTNSPFILLGREQYVDIICKQLEVLPPKTVVQRVTGDPPINSLLAPNWVLNKLWVRNAIDKKFASINSFQGKFYSSNA